MVLKGLFELELGLPEFVFELVFGESQTGNEEFAVLCFSFSLLACLLDHLKFLLYCHDFALGLFQGLLVLFLLFLQSGFEHRALLLQDVDLGEVHVVLDVESRLQSLYLLLAPLQLLHVVAPQFFLLGLHLAVEGLRQLLQFAIVLLEFFLQLTTVVH